MRALDEVDGVTMAGRVNPTFPLSFLTDPVRDDAVRSAVLELVAALTKRPS